MLPSYLFFFVFVILGLYLYKMYRTRKKKRSIHQEIDDVAIRLISGNSEIDFSTGDRVKYFGSIPQNESEYLQFKNSLPLPDKMLTAYFKDHEYDSSGDNLLIFKITKTSFQTFIVVINDPMDMEQDFSLNEIIGPLEE
jgi:hypothetical protein